MMTAEALPVFHLHFDGEAARRHTLPAPALVQAIQALQRSIYLLAMAYQGYELKQRARVNYELERKYALVLGIPEQGGYDLPYQVGMVGAELFDAEDIARITEQHQEVLAAVQASDSQKLRRLVPSGDYRRLVVSELKKIQPPPRMGLVVSIEDFRRHKLLDGKTALERLSPLLAEPATIAIHLRLVAGRLDALDFQSRTLRLYLPNGRLINATYDEDFEPILLENPRELIQVRGEVVLDEDGSLKHINNVREIFEVDTSPLTVESFIIDTAKRVAAKKRFDFQVTFEPGECHYMADGPFNMLVSGETREELADSLTHTLRLLWKEYVESDMNNFTEDAKALRQELLETFSEIVDAA
jgi:hypothetical protein